MCAWRVRLHVRIACASEILFACTCVLGKMFVWSSRRRHQLILESGEQQPSKTKYPSRSLRQPQLRAGADDRVPLGEGLHTEVVHGSAGIVPQFDRDLHARHPRCVLYHRVALLEALGLDRFEELPRTSRFG